MSRIPATLDQYLASRRANGRRGGEATKRNQDPDYYRRIGRLGGKAHAEKNAGTDFYSEIGRLGAAARHSEGGQ